MATTLPADRWVLIHAAMRRRTSRARVAVAVAVVIAALFARHAVAQDAERAPLGAPAARAPVPAAGAWGEAVRVGGALAAVVGLAFAARWWFVRSGAARAIVAGAGVGRVEVLSRQPVGRGQHVLVMRFGPKLLCVQQSRDGLRTLAEVHESAGRPVAPDDQGERVIDLRRERGST
jgi:flagellar biogenesis protein FliO